jgi:hypothetical protein
VFQSLEGRCAKTKSLPMIETEPRSSVRSLATKLTDPRLTD